MTHSIINLDARRHEAPMKRALENLERFTCSAVDWPTPMLSDEDLEYWAQRYEFYDLRLRVVRFITLLQCPVYWLRS